MINTLNETHLHKTLKTIYALKNPESKTEAIIGKSIADILTKEGNVIEIQTASLSHLEPKIRKFIAEGRNITVVYPLAEEKYIETFSQEKKLLRKKKSPKKMCIYGIFKELTKLTPYLLDRHFTLEVIGVSYAEERTLTEEPVQSKNKMRRYKKNWLKTGKRLISIRSTTILHGKKSYKALIPSNTEGLNDFFTVKDLYHAIKAKEKNAKEQDARLMAWVYTRLTLFTKEGIKGRSYIYKRT